MQACEVMARDAVQSELVSARPFPVRRDFTGNFVLLTLHRVDAARNCGGFLPLS
jgi:hypothetical protein